MVSFAHADLGAGDPEQNDVFARALSPLIEAVMAPGGVMVASDAMYFDTLVQLDLPEGAMPDRAFMYQMPA